MAGNEWTVPGSTQSPWEPVEGPSSGGVGPAVPEPGEKPWTPHEGPAAAIVGPPGPKGDQGERGLPGLKGDQGVPGTPGERGEKGDQGERGLPGLQGGQGIPGTPGEKGEQGERGEQGLQGVQGIPGTPGAAGAKGEKGERGEVGAEGAPSTVPGPQGVPGTPGAAGAKGEKGDQGERGLQGLQGVQGVPGTAGAKGEKGDQGERGLQGLKGDQGIPGVKGDQGLQGVPGVKGDTGPKGETGPKGDAALFETEVYQSTTPTGAVLPYGANTLERDSEGFYSLNNWIAPADRAQSKLSRYAITYNAAPALQAALASGLDIYIPAGTFLINSGGAAMSRMGQRLRGAGRNATELYIKEGYTGGDVIRLLHFCEVDDLSFYCNQRDNAATNNFPEVRGGVTYQNSTGQNLTRGTISAYGWMINLTDQQRCRLRRLRLSQAAFGILANGNTGGLDTDSLEIGCLVQGFLVDGALDFVSLRGTHFWPFGYAQRADLMAFYRDGTTIGLDIGRCESLDAQGVKTFGAIVRQRQGDWVGVDGTAGTSFGTITGLSLDGNGAWLEVSAGRVTIAGMYSTKDGPGQHAIKATGGRTIVSGADIDHNSNVAPLFSNGGDLIVSASQVKQYSPDGQHVINYSGTTVLTGNHFDYAGGAQARNTPMVIEVGSGVIRGIGNTFRPRAAGASGQGALFAVSNAGTSWCGNDMGGWQVDTAAGGAKVTGNF